MAKKREKTTFSEHKSTMAKLDHKLKVEEERRMIYRRMKQEGKKNEA